MDKNVHDPIKIDNVHLNYEEGAEPALINVLKPFLVWDGMCHNVANFTPSACNINPWAIMCPMLCILAILLDTAWGLSLIFFQMSSTRTWI